VTSYVNKLGSGVTELSLPHFLTDLEISFIDLFNMQIILIDMYIRLNQLIALFARQLGASELKNKYGGRALDSLAPF
jgi:hypothetical protein